MQNTSLIYRRFGPPLDILELEQTTLAAPSPTALRVAMISAPVNPSDLIPITGAYRQRIELPQVAGYEGVGTVLSAPVGQEALVGKRVLPLRCAGTWQGILDCDPDWAVPVPDHIENNIATRAYINPLAALRMLRMWPVAGKRIMLTGAGSTCANLLAQWAIADGATDVIGIYRSPARRMALQALDIAPLPASDMPQIIAEAARADLVFDAVGGPLGSALLGALPHGAELISYGLLSGQPVLAQAGTKGRHRRFHLRETLNQTSPSDWQAEFRMLWPLLHSVKMPPVEAFPLKKWADALQAFQMPGRNTKPVLQLTSSR